MLGLTRDAEKVEPIRLRNLGPTNNSQHYWWALTGSNRRPLPCKGSALPAELNALCFVSSPQTGISEVTGDPDGFLTRTSRFVQPENEARDLRHRST